MTSPQRNPPGVAGQNFIANVDQLRRAGGMSYEALAVELAKAGHPINQVSLSRLGRGERRAGVDDLVAFAQVLGVTPAQLIQAPGPASPPGPDHAAVREARSLAARIEALIAAAGDPRAAARASAQVDRAIRRVQIEVEELLDDLATGQHDTADPL